MLHFMAFIISSAYNLFISSEIDWNWFTTKFRFFYTVSVYCCCCFNKIFLPCYSTLLFPGCANQSKNKLGNELFIVKNVMIQFSPPPSSVNFFSIRFKYNMCLCLHFWWQILFFLVFICFWYGQRPEDEHSKW